MRTTAKDIAQNCAEYGIVFGGVIFSKEGVIITPEINIINNIVRYHLKCKCSSKIFIFEKLEDALRVANGIILNNSNEIVVSKKNYKNVLPENLWWNYTENINLGKGRGPNKIMRFEIDSQKIV